MKEHWKSRLVSIVQVLEKELKESVDNDPRVNFFVGSAMVKSLRLVIDDMTEEAALACKCTGTLVHSEFETCPVCDVPRREPERT